MTSHNQIVSILLLIAILGSACQAAKPLPEPVFHAELFDAERAYNDVITQTGFGPRFPGSEGHRSMRSWLVRSLEEAGWQPVVLEGGDPNQPIFNIEACRNAEPRINQGYILLGAHYDTRMFADRDPVSAQRNSPVPGANDGASGVAVLLEIARALPEGYLEPLCLVFFDAEDNGRIMGWDWVVGSRDYVAQLTAVPSAVVIVDMVGDTEQYFPVELNSDPELVTEIWGLAARMGIESFSTNPGYAILDDHTAFIQQEIPAVDIIDFDYPYWHTIADTVDKVSADSLKNVGDVLLAWLLGY
jgi:hypothetical protein